MFVACEDFFIPTYRHVTFIARGGRLGLTNGNKGKDQTSRARRVVPSGRAVCNSQCIPGNGYGPGRNLPNLPNALVKPKIGVRGIASDAGTCGVKRESASAGELACLRGFAKRSPLQRRAVLR